MTKVYQVTAGEATYNVVSDSGLDALRLAQDLRLEAWRAEEGTRDYPGFPSSFAVRSLGTLDGSTVAVPVWAWVTDGDA